MKKEKINFEVIGDAIVSKYNENELITHDEMKIILEVKKIVWADYKNDEDYQEALQQLEFEYLQKVENLRKSLLEKHNYWLINIPGKGYVLPDPKRQVEFGLETTKKSVKRKIGKGQGIVTCIRSSRVDVRLMAEVKNKLAAWSMIRKLT